MLGEGLDEGIRPSSSGTTRSSRSLRQPRPLAGAGQAEVDVGALGRLTELQAKTPGPRSRSIHAPGYRSGSRSAPRSLSGLIMAVISFMPFHLPLQSLLLLLRRGKYTRPRRPYMLRMRWNLRMSSLPASSATPVIATTTQAPVLSAVPAMCFIFEPFSAPGANLLGPDIEHLPLHRRHRCLRSISLFVARRTRAESRLRWDLGPADRARERACYDLRPSSASRGAAAS